MKVLSVSHMFPNKLKPNYGIFVKERLKSIAIKVDVSVVAPVPFLPMPSVVRSKKHAQKIPPREVFDGLQVHHPRYLVIPRVCKYLDGFLYYKSMNSFFLNMIMSDSTDLLDFHWIYPDAYAGLKWAKLLNKKIVMTIRGNESICYFEKSLRKKMLIQTLKSADHIISVSSDMKQKVVGEYGVDGNKVTVISNGIDSGKFRPIDKVEALKKCKLDFGKKHILSLCRLSEEKGLEHLLKAFSLLDERKVELLMVGDGPLRGSLMKMAKDLGVADRVHFIGEVAHEDTYKWYNAADVYCLPSLWEGCPNVVIESIACGTPVVATNVGGVSDLVPSEDYGLIVPPGDVSSLTQALAQALRKDWDRELIVSHGASNTWEHVADRVVSVFQEVLS